MASTHSKMDAADTLASIFLAPGPRSASASNGEDGQPAKRRPTSVNAPPDWRLDPFGFPIQIPVPGPPLTLAPQFGPIQSATPDAAESGDSKKAAAMAPAQDLQTLTGCRVGAERPKFAAIADLAFMVQLRVPQEQSPAPNQPPQPRVNPSPVAARIGGLVTPDVPAAAQTNSTVPAPDTGSPEGGPRIDQAASGTASGHEGESGRRSPERQTLETAAAVPPDKAALEQTAQTKTQSVIVEPANQTNFTAPNPNAAHFAMTTGAKTASDQTPSSGPPRSADEIVQQQPEASAPTRQLALRLDHETLPGVSLQLVERDGAIRVAVRTPDSELSGRMQANLNDLVNSLKQEGIEADAWTPAQTTTNGHVGNGNADNQNTGGSFGDSHQSGRRNGERRERRQRDSAPSEISFASQFPL